MPSNSLLREILQRPPVAQSMLSLVQRNLLDSAVATWLQPTLADLTSDISESQRELNYWSAVIDAAQVQQPDGHIYTGITCPRLRANIYYDNRAKTGNRFDSDSDCAGYYVSKVEER
ncbi:unnamed protein product [Gongylonema pulchrum]|uniref:SCP domain-containing protein n=1 Tax=Gongylonema pulchrum TaxID=637853 RepID=A0A183DL58_9BILA|nr:unnamed protein product [Gongylonema pulchrum]